MPQILIKNLNNKLITSNDSSHTVLNIIHDHQIDWMHACGAKGRCTTCKVIVLRGMEGLSETSPAELKFRELRRLKKDERLACQSYLHGNVEVKVAEENKFPHIEYSE